VSKADKFGNAVKAVTGPLGAKVRGLVRIGRVTLLKDGAVEGLARQEVQIATTGLGLDETGKDDELIDDGIVVLQQYGFNSRPKGDGNAECFLFATEEGVYAAIVDDGRYRPSDFEEGESGLYTDEDSPELPGPDKDKRFYLKMARGKILRFLGAAVELAGDPADAASLQ
jgi:phage gp45-like